MKLVHSHDLKTKKATIEHYREMLSTNEKWVIAGLLRIYSFQTEDEKATEAALEANGAGFTGVDAEFLSKLAEHYQANGWLSPKQMAHVYKKMPKYAKQLFEFSRGNVGN